jgi:hypothetical protein
VKSVGIISIKSGSRINGVDGFSCILNHKDRKEINMGSFSCRELDSVVDREEVERHIVDSAVAIHTALGPGLFL